jgi:hypothetical protein
MTTERKKPSKEPATDLLHMPRDEAYEILQEWFMDCGCEAVCPEGCWVEHDGYCEHGYPSWFIALGLI